MSEERMKLELIEIFNKIINDNSKAPQLLSDPEIFVEALRGCADAIENSQLNDLLVAGEGISLAYGVI